MPLPMPLVAPLPGGPSPFPFTITATWTGAYSRDPIAYTSSPPSIAPLAVPVANTAGQWLFALVSWRQDTGQPGVLTYPSSVIVCDDAENFWIPVQIVKPQTGIVRCAVWMAPAARAAEFVFVQPTAYQSALTVLIAEVTAACPWYSVAAVTSTFTNQGTSITAQVDPGSGLFSMGVIARDSSSGSDSGSTSGWTSITQLTPLTTVNGNDHSGDLTQFTFYGTTGPGANSIGDTVTGATCDLAEVIITIHGVTDALPFPYPVPIKNLPVLITELASGPALNADPVLAQGTAHWSGVNASVAAATWPLWNPWPDYGTYLSGSLKVTPSGSSTDPHVGSESEPVSAVVQYSAVALVYSPGGFGSASAGSGIYVGIAWFNSGLTFISTSAAPLMQVPAGAWTQLTLGPVFPPPGAAFGAVIVDETGGASNVPSSAVFYLGYGAFGPADGYQNIPPDQIAWTDFSVRNFSQGKIDIERGIQYEQQALEAGTLKLFLANNDAQLTFGNVQSPFFPTIGDTDVPVRLRTINPASLTPYTVLFSGYTDDMETGWDEEDGTWYGYLSLTASDAWSRLTQQLLPASQEEILQDNPVAFFPCSQTGVNLVPGATTPVMTTSSQFGANTAVASFTSSAISLLGGQGASCWQSTGTSLADQGFTGVALTYYPPAPITVGSGMTVEFVMSPQATAAGQPGTTALTLCTCWSAKGPMWTITLNTGSGQASITVYDKNTGAGTTTTLGSTNYLSAANAAQAWFFSVIFTTASVQVASSPTGVNFSNVTVGANLNAVAAGFSWGGNAGPVYALNIGSSPGFMNVAITNVAILGYQVPPARITQHFLTSVRAWPGELDSWRLARIAGYSGFTPALGMRCLDLPVPPGADLDTVTAITDTNGQVCSSYFTNIASSTLAGMFVNGPGTLIYRRRLEWYDRPAPQWALGQLPPLPVNPNGSFTSGTQGWTTGNGATLTAVTFPPGSPSPVFATAGLFSGNGSTTGPSILFGGSVTVTPVTAGDWYNATAWAWSPQGWPAGVQLSLQFYTSGSVFISQFMSAATPLAAGSLTFLEAANGSSVPGPVRAPATAAYLAVGVQALGTPPSPTGFYVSGVTASQVPYAATGGSGATAAEAPYEDTAKLSADRALMFNEAVLTQYGTNTRTTYTGPNLVFQPTSGITIVITNQPSANQRGPVPYTATLYLYQTAQLVPYYLNEPSMEDFGGWVTQTLGSPLFRPLTITLRPVQTTPALNTALQIEVGDTVTFRRQQIGVPVVQIVTYCSKLTHTIDVSDPEAPWVTKLELSPFPQGSVLAADDVVHGCLTGGNLLGW